MQKILKGLATAVLLPLSLLFGSLSLTTFSPFTQAAYAVDDPAENTDTISDDATPPISGGTITDPDMPTNNPETPSTDPGNVSGGTVSDPDIPSGGLVEDPDIPEDPEEEEEETPSDESVNVCQDETGILSYILCPAVQTISKAIDSIYHIISDFLVVDPITTDATSPIYIVWQYARNLTNIVFVIFLIIVIYSQLTGLGISNYGIKRVLPRLIIAVVLVNLSYLICSIAVDVSNLIGANIYDFFSGVTNDMLASTDVYAGLADISFSSVVSSLLGGTAIAGLVIGITGGIGHFFWMLVVAILGALISIVIALITVSARQAVVSLLIMIAPLAFVAYLLPNTERWFIQWKNLLTRMLVFYPLFSVLFGASQLAGYALMASSRGAFGIILGLGVQVFPLFFSFSLMKMSGTVLGSLNAGLHRLSAPLRGTATRWGMEHAERSRQNYFLNSTSGSARLRQYLDCRQRLRMLDTKTAVDGRSARADARAYMKMASENGRDELGNDRTYTRANRYTRNAKRTSVYTTRAQAAQLYHANTVSAYKFAGKDADQLVEDGGQAYLDYSTQRYREANEAQSDQSWLLNKYIDANTHRFEDPVNYNRLIRNGAGSLGHLGETSIMGQVIVNNAAIEERRRREGRIVFTKFGMNKHKQELRGAAFDCDNMSDDGYETDELGRPIEDEFYNLLPGKTHRHWQRYIGVHKVTGDEITKEQYDSLSAEQRAEYKRVNYFDITDDKGRPVQRVYTDDAGYMKELLVDDIAIGDPINERYELSIGVGKNGKPDGILRPYHSTISAALGHDYKEHDASTTAQIIAQLNNGSVNNVGQLWIAKLESLKNAARPGAILLNDEKFLKQFAKMLSTVRDPDLAMKVFSDEVIQEYENVNRVPLHGAKLKTDENGIIVTDENDNPIWEKVDRYTEGITTQQKRDFVLHKLIPETAQKLFTSLNRKSSPNISERQKPPTLKGLHALLDELILLHDQNLDDSIDINQRLNPDIDIYAGGDPNAVKARIDALPEIQEKLRQEKQARKAAKQGGGNGGGGNGGEDDSHGGQNYDSASGRYDDFGSKVKRNYNYKKQRQRRIDPDHVRDVINGYLEDINLVGVEDTANIIGDYFGNVLCVREELFDIELQELVNNTDENDPVSVEEFIDGVKRLTEEIILTLG